MESGRSAMGSHKHYVSGKPGRSPKFKHNTLIEAQKNEKKVKKKQQVFSSLQEAFKNFRPL